MSEGLSNHQWPANLSEHVFGKWMAHTSTPMKKTQYRVCIHPDCKHVEYRDAPKG